ncbi:hypothetical protein J2D73_19160 [Acetobacter sacchari]|uniref:Uncharacterized protein n=1 Tax=Acetobacter sacchari TaxID=2661687 RepID=A0ABS3M117_9PROT|nr:hypothetical protein [Acetobacter sacchari]MBO1361905.1 hypothetical protein [Acetobacter sacchari]
MATHKRYDCGGHARFEARSQAIARAKLMRGNDMTVQAFSCAVCAGWHIGGTKWMRNLQKSPAPRVVCIGVGGLE